MSWNATSWAWDQEIPAREKVLLTALAHMSNPSTGDTWPSQDALSRRTGLPSSALREALRELEARGLITLRHRGLHGHVPGYHLNEETSPRA